MRLSAVAGLLEEEENSNRTRTDVHAFLTSCIPQLFSLILIIHTDLNKDLVYNPDFKPQNQQ